MRNGSTMSRRLESAVNAEGPARTGHAFAAGGPRGGTDPADQLSPWAREAELGVLAICLTAPGVGIPQVTERQVRAGSYPDGAQVGLDGPLGDGGIFFDFRHAGLFRVLKVLWEEKGIADEVMLVQRLKDWNQLEQIGGMEFIGSLMNSAAVPAMLPEYLDILWEKFLARRAIAVAARMERRVRDLNGLDERAVGAIEREFGEFKELADRSFGGAPIVLKRAGEFMDAAWARWLHQHEKLPGWTLPWPFPLGLRMGELTVMSGDNGSGKSTALSQMAIDVAKQIQGRRTELKGPRTEGEDPTRTAKFYGTGEERICIASFEESPDVGVWRATRQILGTGRLPLDVEAGQGLFIKAVTWLNKYFWYHDFVGIGSWRDVLDVFRYARDHEGCRFFVLDSVMRIGIPEDDLAQQSLAAAAMATFVMEKGRESHMVIVGHENKAGEGAKNRVQGSKRWTDNAHLFVQMRRNAEKAEQLEEAKELARGIDVEREKAAAIRKKWSSVWDSKFLLHKQRYPGAPQNGSAHLFFDGGAAGSLQFRKEMEEGPTSYLD
jgi:energy-coupling factor transporter ATP-binding protein EcfA2